MPQELIVAFDVDGTLLDLDSSIDEEIRAFLITWSRFPHVSVHVWSGSGEIYARMVAQKIGITDYVTSYSDKTGAGFVPDIAFDDQDVRLGRINVRVCEEDDSDDQDQSLGVRAVEA